MLSDHYFVIDAEVKCDSADVAREETGVQMMSWTPRSLHSPSKADGHLEDGDLAWKLGKKSHIRSAQKLDQGQGTWTGLENLLTLELPLNYLK